MLGSSDEARPRDPVHIKVEEPEEMAYWMNALKVDESTLRNAIQAVGFAAADVRDYLKWRQAAHPA